MLEDHVIMLAQEKWANKVFIKKLYRGKKKPIICHHLNVG